jgi:hypothetical protein
MEVGDGMVAPSFCNRYPYMGFFISQPYFVFIVNVEFTKNMVLYLIYLNAGFVILKSVIST